MHIIFYVALHRIASHCTIFVLFAHPLYIVGLFKCRGFCTVYMHTLELKHTHTHTVSMVDVLACLLSMGNSIFWDRDEHRQYLGHMGCSSVQKVPTTPN